MPPKRPVEERFWEKVAIPDGADDCWTWTASGTWGYGYFVPRHGLHVRAHRFMWELVNAPIPAGMLVCHTCDNRLCVRPSHLFLGTQADNVADMVSKGRHRAPGVFGIANSSARLTPDLVREIRIRYAAGGLTQKALAQEYGITAASVWAIVHGRTWVAAGVVGLLTVAA